MTNLQIDPKDKERIAIVAVGYNRVDSIRRLLKSLTDAHYLHGDIPLFISIDCSGNVELYDFVNKFQWNNGNKYVNIQEERLGLKQHIIKCGDLTQYFRAVIILEDDIYVSPYFYSYVEQAVDFYYDDLRIGGISLYKNEMIGRIPVFYMNDGSDTYLRMGTATWGECFTNKQWALFKKWYSEFTEDRFVNIDMPEDQKRWGKAWSKYYKAYLVETGRYFVFPQVSHTTCFVDAGEHSSSSSNVGHSNLIMGTKRYFFRSYEEMLHYDVYDNNEALYEWLGLNREELCIDFRCDKINIRKCRYILTPAVLDCKIVKKFALALYPYELNVKFNIPGEDLFLYDTIDGEINALTKGFPDTISNYLLRGYSGQLAAKYVFRNYKKSYFDAIKRILALNINGRKH